MKRLIINGDDYGYNPEKSEGILKAHTEGILTSTTLMVNIVSKQEIDSLSQHEKTLGVGLHLNLTRGKPVSLPEEVPTLINEKGEMFRPAVWTRQAWNDFGNMKNAAEVELEFNNQLKKFKELLGANPTHLDSHHFITSHKKIFPLLMKIAEENEIPVRLPAWIKSKSDYLIDHSLAKNLTSACKTTDHAIFDFFCEKQNPLEELEKAIKSLKEGTTEMMFHPSTFKMDDEKTVYGKIDLDLLTNKTIKELIKKEGIQLTNYKNL